LTFFVSNCANAWSIATHFETVVVLVMEDFSQIGLGTSIL
jgi:hypothetical protein